MLKLLYDRVAYAFIGFVLGTIIGAAFWYLYDFGGSVRTAAPSIHLGVKEWVLYGGGVFAAIGLVFGPGVGSAAGATSREVYDYESQKDNARIPGWVAATALLVALVALGMWYVSASR